VHSFQGLASLSEVLLHQWETFGDQSEVITPSTPLAEIIANTDKVLTHSTTFARLYPIGRPWLRRNQGTRCWLEGNVTRARTLWEQSIAAAVALEMPFDEGWARYELGRHLPVTDPARREQLTQAVTIFTQLGAAYNLLQTQRALAQYSPQL
jgi:hypothetical protein